MFLLGCVITVAYQLLRLRFALYLTMPLLIIGFVAMMRFDRVKVVGQRNPRYCPACRYNLTGSIDAGLDRCPECGQSIDPTGSVSDQHGAE